MATVQANEHVFSHNAITAYVDDPADATVARYIGWVDMRDFAYFAATCVFYSGTGVLTYKIFAAEDTSATNATEIKAHSTPTTADASGDLLVLEVSAEQIAAVGRAAGYALRYVSVQMDNDATNDINVIQYFRCASRHAYRGLTADVIA